MDGGRRRDRTKGGSGIEGRPMVWVPPRPGYPEVEVEDVARPHPAAPSVVPGLVHRQQPVALVGPVPVERTLVQTPQGPRA